MYLQKEREIALRWRGHISVYLLQQFAPTEPESTCYSFFQSVREAELIAATDAPAVVVPMATFELCDPEMKTKQMSRKCSRVLPSCPCSRFTSAPPTATSRAAVTAPTSTSTLLPLLLSLLPSLLSLPQPPSTSHISFSCHSFYTCPPSLCSSPFSLSVDLRLILRIANVALRCSQKYYVYVATKSVTTILHLLADKAKTRKEHKRKGRREREEGRAMEEED